MIFRSLLSVSNDAPPDTGNGAAPGTTASGRFEPVALGLSRPKAVICHLREPGRFSVLKPIISGKSSVRLAINKRLV